MNLQEQILNVDDLRPEPANVEGWPPGVYVRLMPVGSAGRIASLIANADDKQPLNVEHCAEIVGAGLCDDKGEPIFDEDGIEQLKLKKPLRVLEPLVERILQKNGFTDVEDRAGN